VISIITGFRDTGCYRDPIAVTPMRLDAILNRVPIGYAIVEIIIELETCHIYKTVLQTV
jgi:hypothetical protein